MKKYLIWLQAILFFAAVILNLAGISACAKNTGDAGEDTAAPVLYNYFVSAVEDGEVAECVTKEGSQIIFDGKPSDSKFFSIDIPITGEAEITVSVEVISGTVSGSSGAEFTEFAEDPSLVIDGAASKNWNKLSNKKWVYTVPAGTGRLKLGFYINRGYCFKRHTIAVTITDRELIEGYYGEELPETYNYFVTDVEDGKIAEGVTKEGYELVFDGNVSVSKSSNIRLPIIGEEAFTVAIEVVSGSVQGSQGSRLNRFVEDPCLMIDGSASRDWDKVSDKKWIYRVPAGTKTLNFAFYVNKGYTFYEHTIAVTVTDSQLIDNYYDEYYLPDTVDMDDEGEEDGIYNYFVSGVADGSLAENAKKDGHTIVFDGQAASSQSLYLSIPVAGKKAFQVAIEAVSGTSKGSSALYETKITENPCLVVDGIVVRDWDKVSDEKWIYTVPAGTSFLQLGFFVNSAYTFYRHTLAVTVTANDLIDHYYGEYLADAPAEVRTDDTVTEHIAAEIKDAEENGRTVCFLANDGYDWNDGKTPDSPKKTLSQYIGKSNVTLMLKNGDTFYVDRSFTPGENVRITSYGDSYCGEEKPLVSGLRESEPLRYDGESGLYVAEIADSNIGLLIIDGTINWKRVTVGEDRTGVISNNGEWDVADGVLKIRSSSDLAGKRVQYTADMVGIRVTRSNNSVDDIEVAYFGLGGIYTATDVNNFSATNCYVHHIGGAIGGEDLVRCGNGIQVWLSACNNHFISGNRVADCFDAGITAQVTNTVPRDASYSCENIVFEKNIVENCMYLIETFQSNAGGMHCNVEYNGNYLKNCCDFVGAAYRKNTAYMAQICTWRIVNEEDVVAYRDNICIESEQYSISMMKEDCAGTYIWENNVFVSDQEEKVKYPELYTGMDTFLTVPSDDTDSRSAE